MAEEIQSYRQAVEELENIVRQMQSPDCDIDKLSGYTSRALQLLKYCKEKLLTTEQEVKKTIEEFS